MLGGEVVPVVVQFQVPDVNIPSSDGVLDDEAGNNDTVDTEDSNKHMHEQAAAAAPVDTETSLDDKGKRGPKDDMVKVIADQVGGDDDDPAGDVKSPQY